MEVFFNIFKIKFIVLLDLLKKNEEINIGSNDEVHIYINLEYIFSKLCNPTTVDYIKVNKNSKIEFIANVINLAAHYRLFFNKYKINSKIFLYMPSFNINSYKNTLYNPEYRMYYRFRFSENAGNVPVYKMIIESLPFLHLITEYIEGVYFIESNDIENSLIPKILVTEHTNVKNFIITADLYDLQYVNHDFNIVVPKGENSIICTRTNVISYLKGIYECKGEYTISSNFLSFIISIIGSKSRNIYNIKGIGMKKTFKLIQHALNEKLISNNIDNILLLLNVLNPDIRDKILENYYCVDVVYQENQLTKKDFYIIESQVKDKFDNIALRQINDKYFKQYPIMLQELIVNKRNKIDF